MWVCILWAEKWKKQTALCLQSQVAEKRRYVGRAGIFLLPNLQGPLSLSLTLLDE